jgi:uncharacterized protein (DUF58 family)
VSARQTLTQRGVAFLAAGAVLLAAGVLLGQRDLTRLGVLVLGLLLACHALARWRPIAVSVERAVSPSRISVDERARVRVSTRNEADVRTPLLLAEERLDPGLGDRPRFTIPPTGAGTVSEVEYTIRPHLRGVHRLGPLDVWSRDPFGLTSARRPTTGTDAVLVIPRIHDLTTGRALGRGVGSEGSVPHQVALHGEDDQSIRDYREGDDLRRIHWPATARQGTLMVRQEDRPARRRAVVLLDSRSGQHVGRGATSSFEWFVTMAASIASHFLDLGYAVHLLTSDPTADTGVRSDGDLDTMLDTLATMRPGPDDGFRSVLRSAHLATGTGGLLVALVSALDEDGARALAALRQPGSTAVAFVHGASAEATRATLASSGWLASSVAGSEPPARAWAVVTGASHVGSGR